MSALSKTECMWVEVMKRRENTCLLSSTGSLCVVLNALQQSYHLTPLYLTSSSSQFAETLMDSRWATTELAWTTFPESGVSYLFIFFVLQQHLFHLLVNRAQSALNSTPPAVLYLCFRSECLLFRILCSRRAQCDIV